MLKPFRIIGSAILLTIFLVSASLQGAGLGTQGYTEAAVWKRMGLVSSWTSVVRLDRLKDRVKFVHLHVQGNDRYTAYEVASPRGIERFSSRDLDVNGKPLGDAKVRQQAEQRVRDLTAMGYDAKLVPSELAEVRLYVQTELGVLQAIDAESGRSIWSNQLGDPGDRVFPIAIRDQTLAAVTGTKIFVYDAASGAEIWTTQMAGTPQAGPAFSDTIVMVPQLNGLVDGFHIPQATDEFQPQFPARFVGSGFVTSSPVVSGNLAAWATDQGLVHVATLDPPRTKFRINTAPIFAQPVFRGNDLILIDERGYVKSFDASVGKIVWQTSTGKQIDRAPLVVDDDIYIASRRDGLLCLDASSGDIKWQSPAIAAVLAVTGDSLYVQDYFGGMRKMDRGHGRVIVSGTRTGDNVVLSNTYNDRIYNIDRTGRIVCLHETNHGWPRFHVLPASDTPPADAKKEAAKPPVVEEPQPGSDTEPTTTENPFEPDENGKSAPSSDPLDASEPAAGEAGGTDNEDPFGDP